VLTSEPSDGVVGSKIRALTARLPPEEEAHLFTEDRKDHLNRVIIPSLNQGVTVICDRYVYSSVAYQGARGLDPDELIEINRSFALWPDVNFLLEVSVEIALARIRSSRADGFTPFETAADLEEVAKIYAELSDPSIVRIPGNTAPEEIHARIVSELDRLGL
jgi:dTMP kinase